MQSRPLFAPWRMDYIKSVVKGEDDDKCFLCQAAAARTDEERRQRLTLWTTGTAAVVINRYPYTNGHLLIFPIAHKADLEELTQEEQLDLQALHRVRYRLVGQRTAIINQIRSFLLETPLSYR